MYWFFLILLVNNMPQAQVTAGPFPTLSDCYAIAALGVEKLGEDHKDKVFRGSCLEDKAILTAEELLVKAKSK